MSASTQCPHNDLHFELNNQCFGDTNLHYLEISARCKICDKQMLFRGPGGLSPAHPTVSLFGDQVNLPFLGEGEEVTGKPTGYSISTRPGGRAT